MQPEAANAAIPPLLLQPLLENAAEHGLTTQDGSVLVEVDAACEAGAVRIVVRNRASLASPGKRGSHRGLGLELVRERLRAAFGPAASLTTELTHAGTFLARLTFPRQEMEAGMSGMQAAIRMLIVDDETPARQWMRTLCAQDSRHPFVGECATASEASRALRTSSIDLLLLDIQLGAHTGFQVLDGVACSAVPNLVFVTAHDKYAVRAFDRRAVDYLLKPVREDRFRESLERVRRQLRGWHDERDPVRGA